MNVIGNGPLKLCIYVRGNVLKVESVISIFCILEDVLNKTNYGYVDNLRCDGDLNVTLCNSLSVKHYYTVVDAAVGYVVYVEGAGGAYLNAVLSPYEGVALACYGNEYGNFFTVNVTTAGCELYLSLQVCLKLYVVCGHLGISDSVLEPAEELCYAVICEEVNVCSYGKEAVADKIAVYVIELYPSYVLNVKGEVYGYRIILDVVGVDKSEKKIYVLLILGVLSIELVYEVPEVLAGRKVIGVGVVEDALCIIEDADDILIHKVVGGSVYYVINCLVEIFLCKVEVLLILHHKLGNLLVGVACEIYVILDDLSVKDTLEVDVLKNCLKIVYGKLVIQVVYTVSICHKCREDLMLEPLGKLTALCSLKYERCKLVRNGYVNYDLTVCGNIEVYKATDDVCHCSDLVVCSVYLTGKSECYATEVGIYYDLVRECHLLVSHLGDFIEVRYAKNEILDCAYVDGRCLGSVVNYLAADAYAVKSLDKLKSDVLSSKLLDKSGDVKLSHNLCLCLIDKCGISICYDALDIIDRELKNNGSQGISINTEDVVVNKLFNCSGRNVVGIGRNSCRYGVNVSDDLLVSKIEKRLRHLYVLAEKPSYICIRVLVNLLIYELCLNFVVNNVLRTRNDKSEELCYIIFIKGGKILVDARCIGNEGYCDFLRTVRESDYFNLDPIGNVEVAVYVGSLGTGKLRNYLLSKESLTAYATNLT